jgi:hypothetical protein
MPEEIKNSDGKDKQDCEINAAKRLLEKIRKSHPKLKVSWLWENLRVFFQIMIFKDWETFLNTAFNPP